MITYNSWMYVCQRMKNVYTIAKSNPNGDTTTVGLCPWSMHAINVVLPGDCIAIPSTRTSDNNSKAMMMKINGLWNRSNFQQCMASIVILYHKNNYRYSLSLSLSMSSSLFCRVTNFYMSTNRQISCKVRRALYCCMHSAANYKE